MNSKMVISLSLAISAIFFHGVESATFTVKNNCPYTIWPGTLTGAGLPQLSLTGFELAPAAVQTVDAPAGWSGRFWARTGCATDGSGRFTCQTADCGSGQIPCSGAGAIPPATLVELTLNGSSGLDFYDVSLVDGFNIPVSLTPQGGGAGCQATSCPSNINNVCPAPLVVTAVPGGPVVACKSACLAFNTPQYCCTGPYGSPETCPPTDYSKLFKQQCPQAYSYAFDDKSSTFTCGDGPSYDLTFCP